VRLTGRVVTAWTVLISWFFVIHCFSATPAGDLPRSTIPHADKIFHAAEYFVLGILLIRTFDMSDFKLSLAKSTVFAIIIALSYAALDEWFQVLVPGRACDLFDFLADSAGAVTGILLYAGEKKYGRGNFAAH